MTGAIPTEATESVTERLMLARATNPRTPEEWIRHVDMRLARQSKQLRAIRRWVQLAIALSLLTSRFSAKEIGDMLSALKGAF